MVSDTLRSMETSKNDWDYTITVNYQSFKIYTQNKVGRYQWYFGYP